MDDFYKHSLDFSDNISCPSDTAAVSVAVPSLNPGVSAQSQKTPYAARARQLLKAGRAFDKVAPGKLFRVSPWNIMLELYIDGAAGADVCIKQAIIASGECSATGMRVISRLETSGFLCRKGDEKDLRRVLVSLTPSGQAAMELLLEQLDSDPVSTPDPGLAARATAAGAATGR